MARNLKKYRKINIDGEIYHWKIQNYYHGTYIYIYDPDFILKKFMSDDYYSIISAPVTPAYIEYIIRNNIDVIDEEHMKEFLFNRIREKKIKRILNK